MGSQFSWRILHFMQYIKWANVRNFYRRLPACCRDSFTIVVVYMRCWVLIEIENLQQSLLFFSPSIVCILEAWWKRERKKNMASEKFSNLPKWSESERKSHWIKQIKVFAEKIHSVFPERLQTVVTLSSPPHSSFSATKAEKTFLNPNHEQLIIKQHRKKNVFYDSQTSSWCATLSSH